MVTTIGWVEDAEGVAFKNTKVGGTQLPEALVEELINIVNCVFHGHRFASFSIATKEPDEVIT